MRQSLFLIKKLVSGLFDFVKEENMTQEFSCPFCDIFQNTVFTKHLLRVTASGVFCLHSIYINFYDLLGVE